MKSRTRRVMMFTGGMVAAWTVASFMSAEMIRPASSEAMALNPVASCSKTRTRLSSCISVVVA